MYMTARVRPSVAPDALPPHVGDVGGEPDRDPGVGDRPYDRDDREDHDPLGEGFLHPAAPPAADRTPRDSVVSQAPPDYQCRDEPDDRQHGQREGVLVADREDAPVSEDDYKREEERREDADPTCPQAPLNPSAFPLSPGPNEVCSIAAPIGWYDELPKPASDRDSRPR